MASNDLAVTMLGWLLAFLASIGTVVILGAVHVFLLWAIDAARQQLRRHSAVWKHEYVVREAIAEWVERNPERAAELERLRERL